MRVRHHARTPTTHAYRALFARLDWLEDRLTTRRYLVGDTITEADVRLWPTLARFDAVYQGHFKCNRNKLIELPALWAYARDLFQTPGFGDTIDFVQTKQHYYLVHKNLNPSGIVPDGPDLSGWLTRHHREELGGRPFGDGTPPGPPPEPERVPGSHTARPAPRPEPPRSIHHRSVNLPPAAAGPAAPPLPPARGNRRLAQVSFASPGLSPGRRRD